MRRLNGLKGVAMARIETTTASCASPPVRVPKAYCKKTTLPR
jgi:hypothetical protein